MRCNNFRASFMFSMFIDDEKSGVIDEIAPDFLV